MSATAVCIGTRREVPDGAVACPDCGGAVGFAFDLDDVHFDDGDTSMWRYRRLLPLPDGADPVSLGEGRTPLTRASRRDAFGGADVRWKNETLNPSGSHKDRALSVAASVATARGASTVFVASAGSTGLAAAAYAARAGLRCVVVVGADAPEGRLLPLRIAGADVVRVGSSVDDALDRLGELARTHGLVDLSTRRSGNPWQAEGPKTIAYEIVESLETAPDVVVIPIGGGGTIAGIARGFEELREMGRIERVPRLVGTQPAGYETLVTAITDGLTTEDELRAAAFTDRPPTVQVKTAHTFAPDGKAATFTESVIREMTRLANLHGAINLAQGFPDFPAPAELKEAAADGALRDVNQYAITWGARPLREAIAAKTARFYPAGVDPETEITVTCGATEG
jgi:threonine synthase